MNVAECKNSKKYCHKVLVLAILFKSIVTIPGFCCKIAVSIF